MHLKHKIAIKAKDGCFSIQKLSRFQSSSINTFPDSIENYKVFNTSVLDCSHTSPDSCCMQDYI